MVSFVNPPRFVPGHVPPPRAREASLLFATRGLELLVAERGGTLAIPSGAEFPTLLEEAHFLGTLEGRDCYAVAYPKEQPPPPGMKWVSARGLFTVLDDVWLGVAGRALAIAEWDVTHRFCGRCGQPTGLVAGERARRCPACHTPYYPRISPAIIVLISQGERMLLARAASFPDAFFSTLAGFVEPGESLEETVLREVKEEVGIELKNLRYFGSQPWPFGRSLMVGFNAEYAGGELKVDGQEILEAHWYPIDALPRIPPPLSIARRLIDAFAAQVQASRRAGGG
jgi:NAD+ diphosphatase